MKKIIAILPILALLASCSVPMAGSSASSITFTVPVSLAASAARSTVGGNEARLWLYNGNQLYPNGSTAYYSATYSGASASITVSGIPDGANYTVTVATGTTTGTSFVPNGVAVSSPFSVATGATSNVSLTLKDLSTSLSSLSGINLVSIKEIGSTLYAATPNGLYSGLASAGVAGLATQGTLSNGTINSLTAGYDLATSSPFLLVNTTQGVYNGGLVNLVAQGSPSQPNVSWSGAVSWSAAGSNFYTYLFMGSNILGGTYSPGPDPGAALNTATWRTVDLSSLPGINGNPLLDFALTSSGSGANTVVYGFFATRILGMVRVNSSWLQQVATLKLSDMMDSSNTYFQYIGEGLPLIKAVGLVSDPNSSTKTLFLGTSGGAYVVPDALAATLAAPTLLPQTRGLDITRIVTDRAGDVAFFAATDVFVRPVGKPLIRLPFLTSVVGTLQDARWSDSPSTSGRLYLVGTEGAAQVDVSALE